MCILFSSAVSQAEQIVYSTESSLEEENDAIVRQVVATHNKSLQSSDDGMLRKFRSMPHVMRSFFQSDSGSSSNSGSNANCCGSDGKPNKIDVATCISSIANVSVSCRYHVTVLEKEV